MEKMCNRCSKKLEDKEVYKSCSSCRTNKNLAAKERYKKNPEKYKAIARKQHDENREKINKKAHEWRKNLRLSVLNHYSNGKLKCACCGENTYDFLTVDHVNNNGTKERKESGGGGHHNYRRIIKLNFPEGYQILCFNCNCGRAKTKDKICPHKL